MKKHSMKMIVTLLSLLLLLTSVGILSGCLTESDKRRFDTELFKCMYNEDNTGVIILELTEKGKEQEILVIPKEINNFPVVQLGGVTGYPNWWHLLESQTAKKVYFPFSLVGIGIVKMLSFPNATVVVMGLSAEKNRDDLVYIYTRDLIECKRYVFDYFVDKEKIKNLKGNDSNRVDLCENANVQFIWNEEVRYIDYIADGEIYLLPEAYDASLDVTNWYLDEKYEHLWDGNYLASDKVLYLYGK